MVLAILSQTRIRKLRYHALARTDLITISFKNSRPFELHAFKLQCTVPAAL